MASTALEPWFLQNDPLPAHAHIFGAGPLAKALIVGEQLRRQGPSGAPILFVAASRAAARNFIDNYRFFFGSTDRVHYLPAIEFDYHRSLLPNPDSLCERNVALYHALNDAGGRIFVTSALSLIQKTVPAEHFLRSTLVLEPGKVMEREAMVRAVMEAGYQQQPTAGDPGVFSVRGGVIDIFSPLYENPLRVEFFDDEIEEIRFYDPKTQLSLDKISSVSIVPVGLALFPTAEEIPNVSAAIKERLDSMGVPRADRDDLLLKLREGTGAIDFGFLFPLLSGSSSNVLEFFPNRTIWIADDFSAIETQLSETDRPRLEQQHALYEKQPHPIAEFSSLFDTTASVLDPLKQGIAFETFESSEAERKGADWRQFRESPISLQREREAVQGAAQQTHALFQPFAARFREWMETGFAIHVVCHTVTHAQRLQHLCESYQVPCKIEPLETGHDLATLRKSTFESLTVRIGSLTQSGVFDDLKLVLLSEEEIFGVKKRSVTPKAKRSASAKGNLLDNWREMKVGDYVVHTDHGIGRYLELKPMEFLGNRADYFVIQYRDGDKLYVPIYRLNVLQKYVGSEGGSPVLDKLGGERWAKAKGKAQRAVAELAAELIELQARRKLLPGPPFQANTPEYEQFELEFAFDETADQWKAIQDISDDLQQPHPMDRLLCGDVGYGKTEVAMRAVCRCVLSGYQSAVLVPTTVLAFQHFQTFKNRFRNLPVRIEMISRLRTNTEIKKAIEAAKEGKIDILVGTHRLLSSDVGFKKLGLVVVDEEHRFGVVHKEKLKKSFHSVHHLSMTATPIPRTLNMAMTGIKGISLLTTPPPDRLAVRTFVCRRTSEVMAEAISAELARGGQVFFVHNRIETLQGVADELKALFPRISIEVTHGQMDGDTLEEKMLAFYRGDAQILLTTTIIESGLDIPRANTILIDDAQNLGLAQLYQLRGRVGRAEKRAFCYLLTPPESSLSSESKQRIQVIQRYSELGGGFSIASHDMDIRGAGDLLGKDQSGHFEAIGVDLYFDLLEQTLRELRGEAKRIEIEPEISMQIDARFPDEYLSDIGERIAIYRRLSSAEHEEEIADIESEIRDRFGTPPEQVGNLIGLMRLKLYLKQLHVVRMNCGPKKTSLQFADSTPATPEKIVKLVSKHRAKYTVTPDSKLVFTAEGNWESQLQEVVKLVDYFLG